MATKTQQPKPAGIPKWGILLGVVAALWAVCSYLDSIVDGFYIMTPEALATTVSATLEEAREAGKAQNATYVVGNLLQNLDKLYPEAGMLTDFQDHGEWVFNNAGGAMGSMYIVHASITEYLIIFGSAVGTEGHTGRHTADDYFHILTGQQMAYRAGALEPEKYPAGAVHHLERGLVKQYQMIPETWALEYARGWIPPMLPFGFADMLFSTLDVQTMWHTTRITAREMIKNLLKGKI